MTFEGDLSVRSTSLCLRGARTLLELVAFLAAHRLVHSPISRDGGAITP